MACDTIVCFNRTLSLVSSTTFEFYWVFNKFELETRIPRFQSIFFWMLPFWSKSCAVWEAFTLSHACNEWMNENASLFGPIQMLMYRILHADARVIIEMSYISDNHFIPCEWFIRTWTEDRHTLHSFCVCLVDHPCFVSSWLWSVLNPKFYRMSVFGLLLCLVHFWIVVAWIRGNIESAY